MVVRMFTGLRPATVQFQSWELLYVKVHSAMDDESIGNTIGRTANAVAEMRKAVAAREAQTARSKRKARCRK